MELEEVLAEELATAAAVVLAAELLEARLLE
jgi:hypothetical protein